MWRDPLSNKWQGPDPVLIWDKGHTCIYDSGAQNAQMAPRVPNKTIQFIQGRKTLRNAFHLCLLTEKPKGWPERHLT